MDIIEMLRKRITLIIWFMVMTLVYFFFLRVNRLPYGLSTNIQESWLHFNFPSSNWRSYGPSIFLLPFIKLPFSMFLATTFYWNVGLVTYYKLVAENLNGKWNQIALWSLPFNTYLLWSMKAQQETVLEWAFIGLTLLAMSRKRIYLFSIFALCLSLIRPANLLVVLFILIVFESKLRKKILLPILIMFWLAINQIVYSSASPALQAGQTAAFGWNKAYVMTLPLTDIDVTFSENDILDTKNIDSKNTDKSRNGIYLKDAINSFTEDIPRSIAIITSKIDSWIFTAQRVPNLHGAFSINKEGTVLTARDNSFTYSNSIGSLVFLLWRGFFLSLWFASLVLFTLNWRRGFQERLRLLIFIPIVSLPAAIIATPETRYQIAHMAFLLPVVLITIKDYAITKTIS